MRQLMIGLVVVVLAVPAYSAVTIKSEEWQGNSGAILEDMKEDGSVNLGDFEVLSEKWGESY